MPAMHLLWPLQNGQIFSLGSVFIIGILWDWILDFADDLGQLFLMLELVAVHDEINGGEIGC